MTVIKATPQEMTASVLFPILIMVKALNGLISGCEEPALCRGVGTGLIFPLRAETK